ncbi:hypothetical protein [Chondromyces crocatus]|uniref:Uncharacterized protein n=1 Tax=Chondromyces crocatus TaxID=52 RepID=A0A0K1EAI0_CHOCO|nr:hypothetical protein [Chondromyces crocatus]AKT37891.1 uncharacterized protein CMC5_020340 [Chondromyces crocatus]
MARRCFKKFVCRPLSADAAAWEARMVQALGLEDVPWDPGEVCAVCAKHHRARDEGRPPAWSLRGLRILRDGSGEILRVAVVVAMMMLLVR